MVETRTEPLQPADWRHVPAPLVTLEPPAMPAEGRRGRAGQAAGLEPGGVPRETRQPLARRASTLESFAGPREAMAAPVASREAPPIRAPTTPSFGGLAGAPGPLTGSLVAGRYLVLERLGQDESGARYRVRHVRMQKELVLETLPRPLATPGAAQEASQRVRRASSLDHPALPVVNDAGTLPDGTPYVILDAPPGETLRARLATGGRFTPEEALGLVRPLCRAVEHAHAHGVVFASLDPDHLRLRPGPDGREELQIQRVGPGELAAGLGKARHCSPREDVHALGALLYELLTGEAPAVTAGPRRRWGLGPRLPSIRRRLGDDSVSAALEHVVARALQPHPSDRFASVSTLRRALEELDPALSPATAPAPGDDEAVWPPPRVRARRALVGGVLGGGLVAVLGCLALASLLRPARSGPRSPAPPAAAAPRPRAPTPALARLQTLLEQGRVRDAAEAATALADRYPRDGRVHLAAGHLARLRRRPGLALHHYQRALQLDPGLGRTPPLLEALGQLLTWNAGGAADAEHRRAAMTLLRRYLEDAAVPLVTRYVNTWWEADQVWLGILFLLERGRDERVDYLYAYELLLRTDRSCYRRLAYLQDILRRRDRRFLGLLERVAELPGWKTPHTGHWVRNTCIQPEARAAAEALRALPDRAVAARD